MKKALFYLTKANSYMPLVLLPLCAEKAFGNILFAGISIVIWRLVTYYKSETLNRALQYFIFKTALSIFLILVAIMNINLYYQVTTIVILATMLPVYFTIDKVKKNNITNFILIILGMLVAGFSLYRLPFLNYYLILISILLIYKGKCHHQEKSKLNLKNFYRADMAVIFIHNFHYYLFAFSIPLIFYKFSGKYYMTGIACGLSWLLFLPKDYLTSFLQNYMNIRWIIGVGFLVTSLLLIIIGACNNLFIISFCLIIQGASAGLAEGFWNMEVIRKNSSLYWNLWKLGGIIGGIFGGVIAFFQGVTIVFFISGFLAFLGGIIHFVVNFLEKKANRGLKVGY